jgi:hypothetical protein
MPGRTIQQTRHKATANVVSDAHLETGRADKIVFLTSSGSESWSDHSRVIRMLVSIITCIVIVSSECAWSVCCERDRERCSDETPLIARALNSNQDFESVRAWDGYPDGFWQRN